MENEIKNYGLVVEDVEKGLDSTHYLLGSTSKLGTDIMQADGDWRPFIPKYEPQFFNGYETYGCTVFGTLNALEVLMKKLYGGEYDYAERFIYILAGIRTPGGDPHKVAELVRTKGLFEQSILPMTDTYEQFIQPDPMTQSLLDKAHEFLNDKDITHEWVFTNNPDTAERVSLLKWALQRGPVAMSVTAWYKDENGLYIDGGKQNTHWVCLVALEEVDGKVYPIIIDSYDLIMYGKSTAYFKKLHPDHKVFYAKRYAITPKNAISEDQRKGLLAQIQRLLEWLGIIQKDLNILNQMETTEPILYQTALANIGKHLTLDETVNKNVGCAQCMSKILLDAGFPIPKGGISGTATLYTWLVKNFYKTDKVEKGNIIISVTGTGNGSIRGHVGVLMGDSIASNDSVTGLLSTNWDYKNWINHYQKEGKLKTVIFTPKN